MGDKKTTVTAVIFVIVTYKKTAVTVGTEKIQEDKSGTLRGTNIQRKVKETMLTSEFL